MKQLDIFGNEIDVNDIPTKHRGRQKYLTMQEIHGRREDKQCRTCKHCVGHRWQRLYYKCELWVVSACAATDIRLKDVACKKWEAES